MASLTQKTEKIRKRKHRSAGKGRKKATRAGTTPRFPIHIEGNEGSSLPQTPGSNPKEA